MRVVPGLAQPGASASPAGVLRWRTLLAALLLVVLLIPIRRYAVPGGLPFELEPYRILAAIVLAGWGVALLVDRRVRVRRTGLEWPLLLFAFAAVASLLVNRARLEAVEGAVLKRAGLFAGFLLVLYLVVSVVRTFDDVEFLCGLLVAGGAVVGLLAVVESQTGWNAFNHVLPLPIEGGDRSVRAGTLRAYGSAQHPIALGACLVMLVPLAVHRARRRPGPGWWIAAALLVLGAVSSVSRTSVLMLLAMLLVALVLRARTTARFLPAVVLLVVLAYVTLPDAASALRKAFAPPGGIVSEQTGRPGIGSSGRLADLAPSLREFEQRPLLGQGFGTRVVGGERSSSLLLDNQWLGTLLETGLIGALALLWVFARFLRAAGRASRGDRSARGSLLVALAASVAAYAVGMLAYDAFSFIQVTFVFFVLLGLGASLLALSDDGPRRRRRELPAVRRRGVSATDAERLAGAQR
jgi:hypothetical protein